MLSACSSRMPHPPLYSREPDSSSEQPLRLSGYALALSTRGETTGEFLARWWPFLVVFFAVPLVLAALFKPESFVPPTGDSSEIWMRFTTPLKIANILLLAANVLVLMNLEKTFRATVGTLRWRIKFSLLGLGLIFAVNIYTRIQALLFSGQGFTLSSLESGALVVGCILVGFSYLRSGFAEIDIYPSHAVLNGSLTVLLVGAYLLIVGVLAQFIGSIGGAGSFQAQSFFPPPCDRGAHDLVFLRAPA